MNNLAVVDKSVSEEHRNLRVHYLHDCVADDQALVAEGMAASKPWLHPKFFYDTAGSELFDAITETEEYYPTRTEAEIFDRHLDDMLAHVANRQVLVEPGSGNCSKAEQFLRDPKLSHYAPIEISADFLVGCCNRLARAHPDLTVDAICGDFTRCQTLPAAVPESGRLLFFPGSTIGNFDPETAQDLLANFRSLAGSEGYLLIGTDLPKDRGVLEAAYNDSQGFTRRFNLNILDHLNDRLDCHFHAADFDHDAFYNEDLGRIEMHLVCVRDTRVRVGKKHFNLSKGESIHTENSYKYAPDSFVAMASTVGFEPVTYWTDSRQWFAVHLLRAC